MRHYLSLPDLGDPGFSCISPTGAQFGEQSKGKEKASSDLKGGHMLAQEGWQRNVLADAHAAGKGLVREPKGGTRPTDR